jgi:Domain of unknown function (DUF5615)
MKNCPRAAAVGLRRIGIDLTTTPEAGLIHLSDLEQLSFALDQGRVLFTQNEDFLVLHTAGTSHAGIIYCKKDTRSLGEMNRGLEPAWEICETNDIADQVEHV